MVNTRATRAAKGFAAALVATFVALFGHVAGGGEAPGWIGVVAPLVLSSAVCVLVAGRRLSVIRLSISVVVSQVLFHVLFVLGASPAATVHGHHGSMTMSTTVTESVTSSMGLGHLAAAVVTIGALYFGERVVLGLAEIVRLVASRIRRVALVRVVPDAVPAPPAAAPHVITRSLVDALTVASRRGPPARIA